jgi:hypothetical protein
MQFFLHEIGARIVAILFGADCIRTLWHGFAERKIEYVARGFLSWSRGVFSGDTEPDRYWFQVVIQIALLIGCLYVAIFGW